MAILFDDDDNIYTRQLASEAVSIVSSARVVRVVEGRQTPTAYERKP